MGFHRQFDRRVRRTGQIDSAVNDAVAVYISEQVDPAQLGTKLRDAAAGVLNEHGELTDETGFSSDRNYVTKSQINITDRAFGASAASAPTPNDDTPAANGNEAPTRKNERRVSPWQSRVLKLPHTARQ